MDRITDDAWCSEVSCDSYVECYDTECLTRRVWERLREYEDSRLTPEMCKSIGSALAKGRGTAVIAANRAAAFAIAACILERPHMPIEVIVTLGQEEDTNAAADV